MSLNQQLQHAYSSSQILILGFGREGKSSYQFLRQLFPDKNLAIMDRQVIDIQKLNDPHVELVSSYLQNLNHYDVIFKTAGVPISEPALQQYLQQGGRVTSQMNEFLAAYAAQTIGVTGTKGKSTTSALIYHILRSAGKNAIYGGNIGLPVFELVSKIQPASQIILEISSYQLETVQSSPHIAVLVSFYAEHLNYHQGQENYLTAKARITQFQTPEDIFFYHANFKEFLWLAGQTIARAIPFTDQLTSEDQTILQPAMKHLPAVVQSKNVAPAIIVVKYLGITTAQIGQALRTFQTLPHRLENVGRYKGVTFYDDTLATIPEATIAALETLGKVDVLILGGADRGIQYQSVMKVVSEMAIPHLIFFPPSGVKMAGLLVGNQSTKLTMNHVQTMEEAVRLSYGYLPQGGVVLLSPASPSFGLFQDYEDKSAQYRHWITALAK